MAVVLRLARHGRRNQPFYRLVAADENMPRDGRYLEILGTFNPDSVEGKGALDAERVSYWLSKGARTSPTVKQLIRRSIPAAS